MSYCDTPADFDLNLFMLAMGYEPGYYGLDTVLWSNNECTLITRDGEEMVIETTSSYDDVDTRHDLAIGRAELIKETPPEPGAGYGLLEVRYRLPWPATFDDAMDSFRKLGWFGKMPETRMQMMQRYEWLASGQMVATGFGCLKATR